MFQYIFAKFKGIFANVAIVEDYLNCLLQVGMKKEWIMTDEARLEKKARVEENR